MEPYKRLDQLLKGVGGDITGDVTYSGDETNPTNIITKATLDSAVGDYLPLAGGVMTGEINMGTDKIINVVDPTSNQDAATKKFVDDADALKLDLAGGTMSGAIEMGANKVTGVDTPTASGDATNKLYVDTALASVGTQYESCRLITLTTPAGMAGFTAIDGVTPVDNDRIVVNSASLKYLNGIWLAHIGSWTRPLDADDPAEITTDSWVIIDEGDDHADTGWKVSVAPSTVGTDDWEWDQFSGEGVPVAGYLALTGGTLTGDLLMGQGSSGFTAYNNIQFNSTPAIDKAFIDMRPKNTNAKCIKISSTIAGGGGQPLIYVTSNQDATQLLLNGSSTTKPIAEITCVGGMMPQALYIHDGGAGTIRKSIQIDSQAGATYGPVFGVNHSPIHNTSGCPAVKIIDRYEPYTTGLTESGNAIEFSIDPDMTDSPTVTRTLMSLNLKNTSGNAVDITLESTATGVPIVVDHKGTGNLLELKDNSSTVFEVANDGTLDATGYEVGGTAGISGYVDDGANFRLTFVNGIITAVANSTAGGHS